MADIAYKVRGKNSHEPNHLTFGHYGNPRYDDSAEEWKFLRDATSEGKVSDERKPQSIGLIPLHSQMVPDLGLAHTPTEVHEPLTGIKPRTRRSPERLYAIRFALDSIPSDDVVTLRDSDPKQAQKTTQNTDFIAFGYASAPHESGMHGLPRPIMISAQPHRHTLKVRSLKATEHEDTARFLPSFENREMFVPAPYKELVQALCFSPDKRFLAIQQMSGTSIVIPMYGTTESVRERSPVNSLRFKHVVTLRQADTGGYPHAHVAFQPHSHNHLGVVDTHGNWSAWQLQGRRSTSSRILHKLKLLASGKLLPSDVNLRHFAKNIFFDGWHKICHLERTGDDKPLLVCSRRIARTFNSDGSVRGDVDMRLGNSAAKNWILDVRMSTYHSEICYVLTSSRLQIMRLSNAEKRTDGLELLCSWAHFHGRTDLSLTLNIVETSRATCLCISSTRRPDVWTYWIHWSEECSVAHASDSQLLGMPVDRPRPIERPVAINFEAIRIDSNATSKIRISSAVLVQLVRLYSDGSLYTAAYSMGDARSQDDIPIEAGSALIVPQAKERRIRSSRVVEEDDLVDFVLPDDVVPDHTERTSQPHSSLGTKKPPLKTHDWSDIINLQSSGRGEETAGDAIRNLDDPRTSPSRAQANLQTLAELLPEVRVPDLEEVSGALAVLQYPVGASSDRDGPMQHTFTTVLPTSETLQTRYDIGIARYLGHLSADVPERVRVQTERLCRNAAFDEHVSLLSKQPQREEDLDQLPSLDSLHVRSSPPSSPLTTLAMTLDQSEPTLAVLKQYTNISHSLTTGLSSATTRNILAHMPSDELVDPDTYSYNAVEDRLNRDRTQQEIDDLDERARRKAERAAVREEKRKLQQAKMRNAVTQQSTVVPGLVLSSPQRDPREVQSSQLAPLAVGSSQPGLNMTQPERGAHGERRKVVKKEAKHRVRGF